MFTYPRCSFHERRNIRGIDNFLVGFGGLWVSSAQLKCRYARSYRRYRIQTLLIYFLPSVMIFNIVRIPSHSCLESGVWASKQYAEYYICLQIEMTTTQEVTDIWVRLFSLQIPFGRTKVVVVVGT